MNLKRGKGKGNKVSISQIPICFNCFKEVNLKTVISSKIRVNYKYIICDCGQVMKVIKNNNEESLVRIKRDGKDVREAYDLFFKRESGSELNKDINKSSTFFDFIQDKKSKIESSKKAKRKAKLKVIK